MTARSRGPDYTSTRPTGRYPAQERAVAMIE